MLAPVEEIAAPACVAARGRTKPEAHLQPHLKKEHAPLSYCGGDAPAATCAEDEDEEQEGGLGHDCHHGGGIGDLSLPATPTSQEDDAPSECENGFGRSQRAASEAVGEAESLEPRDPEDDRFLVENTATSRHPVTDMQPVEIHPGSGSTMTAVPGVAAFVSGPVHEIPSETLLQVRSMPAMPSHRGPRPPRAAPVCHATRRGVRPRQPTEHPCRIHPEPTIVMASIAGVATIDDDFGDSFGDISVAGDSSIGRRFYASGDRSRGVTHAGASRGALIGFELTPRRPAVAATGRRIRPSSMPLRPNWQSSMPVPPRGDRSCGWSSSGSDDEEDLENVAQAVGSSPVRRADAHSRPPGSASASGLRQDLGDGSPSRRYGRRRHRNQTGEDRSARSVDVAALSPRTRSADAASTNDAAARYEEVSGTAVDSASDGSGDEGRRFGGRMTHRDSNLYSQGLAASSRWNASLRPPGVSDVVTGSGGRTGRQGVGGLAVESGHMHEDSVATEEPLAQLPVRIWLGTSRSSNLGRPASRIMGDISEPEEEDFQVFEGGSPFAEGHPPFLDIHRPAAPFVGAAGHRTAPSPVSSAGLSEASSDSSHSLQRPRLENSSSWQVADELGHTGGMAAPRPRYLLVRLGECIPAETGAAPVHLSRLDTGPQWREFLDYGAGVSRKASLSLDDVLTCPCCLTIFKQPIALPCGHCLCRNCFARITSQPTAQQRRCPLCRAEFPSCELRVNLALAAVCDSVRTFRVGGASASTGGEGAGGGNGAANS